MLSAKVRRSIVMAFSGMLLAAFTVPASAQTGGYYYSGDWPEFYRGSAGGDQELPRYMDTFPNAQAPSGLGKVTVNVPDNAQVRFNDLVSPKGYTKRWFETPTLRREQPFSVTIRAEWTEGTLKVEESRTIVLHAGESFNIDLAKQPTSGTGATTTGTPVSPSSPPAPSGTRTDRQSRRP